ncbi:MAG: hypothetical protein LBG62_04960 [Candidatus Methanoplasma sp.]|nr:hypothetical protein [Candidatus Methanoplasma sp.]
MGRDSKPGRGIYGQVVGMPEQIEEALRAERPSLPRPRRICICGMGTSALAGEIASDYADEACAAPLHVQRGPDLPGWAGPGDAAVVISYSGDTEEMLLAYGEAASRGCAAACVTSGGRLMEMCARDGAPVVAVPDDLSSRGSFGSLLGSLAVALDGMGEPGTAEGLESTVPALKAHRDRLVGEGRGEVERFARAIRGRIPVVYGLGNMRSSAVRWKTQINENSGFVSSFGYLPEFAHNEIVGWMGDSARVSDCVPIFLCDGGASGYVKTIVEASRDTLEENGIEVLSYRVDGGSNLERNLKCMLFGDLVSIELARLRMTDPDAGEGGAARPAGERRGHTNSF